MVWHDIPKIWRYITLWDTSQFLVNTSTSVEAFGTREDSADGASVAEWWVGRETYGVMPLMKSLEKRSVKALML